MIHSDFDLPRDHRLLRELSALRADIAHLLELPLSQEPVHVYLFGSPIAYESFLEKRFPKLPRRRAFFVETDTELTVYAHWGERIAEDLRHEVAHGYLHGVVDNLPLWMDEGLAEYLEVPPGWQGLNRPHVELLMEELRAPSWRPDLARLERIGSAADMTQRDYAESWAWIHWLLNSTPARRELLRSHLHGLRTTGQAPALSQVLAQAEPQAALDQLLLAHLQGLHSPPQ